MLVALTAAAAPVIVPGDGAEALDEVAARTGLPVAELTLVGASALLPAEPAGARPCSGRPIDAAGLGDRLATALAAYDAGRLAEAVALSTAAWDAIPCLAEPLPEAAWDVAFVAGVGAWAEGDAEGAGVWWERARALDPKRGWDDDFAPRAGALDRFATAVPAPGATALRAVGGPFLVDGRPADATLQRGTRVLQSVDPVRTWVIDVGDAPVLAVHPAVTGADVVGFAALPDRWGDLCALVAARWPEAATAYVVAGGEVHLVEPVAGRVARLPPPPEPAGRRVRWSHVALGLGAATLAGAAVNTAVAWPAARQAAQDGSAAERAGSTADFDAALARWQAARTQLVVGYTAGGAGVVLAGAGAVGLGAHRGTPPVNSPSEAVNTSHVDRPYQVSPCVVRPPCGVDARAAGLPVYERGGAQPNRASFRAGREDAACALDPGPTSVWGPS